MIIHAYSTALFSTWINIEDLALLLDAGDGVSAALLQKSRKIKHIFITHADRDHLMGLFRLNALNARPEFPIIHYPKDCGSFPAIHAFHSKFDHQVKDLTWTGLSSFDEIPIKKGYYIQAIRNEHVACPIDTHKSLSYKLYETKQKLKAEYTSLNKKELATIRLEHGNNALTETVNTNILSYAGDTPVDNYSKWDKSGILIHEATFLPNDKTVKVKPGSNRHSTLDEVIKMVSEINVERLILNHFSPRYSKEEIDSSVIELCKKFNVKIPVNVIYPGVIHRNILEETPVFE